MVWRNDRDVLLLQEVTLRLELVVVSDLTSFSPAVWIQPPQSCLHKLLHHICLLSVGIAAHVVVGGGENMLFWLSMLWGWGWETMGMACRPLRRP